MHIPPALCSTVLEIHYCIKQATNVIPTSPTNSAAAGTLDIWTCTRFLSLSLPTYATLNINTKNTVCGAIPVHWFCAEDEKLREQRRRPPHNRAYSRHRRQTELVLLRWVVVVVIDASRRADSVFSPVCHPRRARRTRSRRRDSKCGGISRTPTQRAYIHICTHQQRPSPAAETLSSRTSSSSSLPRLRACLRVAAIRPRRRRPSCAFMLLVDIGVSVRPFAVFSSCEFCTRESRARAFR